MKNLYFNPFSLLFLCFFTSISYSQERTLTGSVTTLKNIAVVNAEIKVLSSKAVVLTDTLGNFKVSCLLKDKIKVIANGFSSQKVKIDKKTEEAFINLRFKPKEKNIDVAVGYGHIKEKDKSYAISSIKNDKKNDFSKYSDMLDVIVNISPSIQYSPGGGISIRGEGSLLGSSSALILLDGIAVTYSQLSAMPPSDVKSVDVLKGSAAAIYGSRGANGVVIVTTKKGGDDD